MKKVMYVLLLITISLFGCNDSEQDASYQMNVTEGDDNSSAPQEVTLTSMPKFDGQLSWGFPSLTSVSLDMPITRESHLRGGGKRGFVTFDISNIDWEKAENADLIIYLENSNLEESNSNYVIKIWKTADSDYANMRDCACGQISMSPPTFGCIPEECGYPVEAPADPLLPHSELDKFTLEESFPALTLSSPEFLRALKDNFQGKTFITIEIDFQCSYNCVEGYVIISDGYSINQPTLIITQH